MAVSREERFLKAILSDEPGRIPKGVSKAEKLLEELAKRACENDTFNEGGGGTSLPSADPYQYLVTNGAGEWEAADRLAYEGVGRGEEIVPEGTYKNNQGLEDGTGFEIRYGDRYIVVYDGVEYHETAKFVDGSPGFDVLGNTQELEYGTWPEDEAPFCIYVQGDIRWRVVLSFKDKLTHTVAVYREENITHPIDPQTWLPEGYPYDTVEKEYDIVPGMIYGAADSYNSGFLAYGSFGGWHFEGDTVVIYDGTRYEGTYSTYDGDGEVGNQPISGFVGNASLYSPDLSNTNEPYCIVVTGGGVVQFLFADGGSHSFDVYKEKEVHVPLANKWIPDNPIKLFYRYDKFYYMQKMQCAKGLVPHWYQDSDGNAHLVSLYKCGASTDENNAEGKAYIRAYSAGGDTPVWEEDSYNSDVSQIRAEWAKYFA